MSKSIDVPVSERNAEQMHMKLQQVSDNCYAVLCEKNRVMDANSGWSTLVRAWSLTPSRSCRMHA